MKGVDGMNLKEDAIRTYEKILNGEQKTFSPYFFQPQHRKERLITLIRYLIEEKLGFTPEEALEKLTMEHIKQYQLTCILRYIDKPVEFADDDVRHLVYFAYPHLPQPTVEELAISVYKDVLEGRRKTFPKNYFLNGELGEKRAIICFRYLCEEILKLPLEEIPKVFSGTNAFNLLAKYKLKIVMNILFFSTADLLRTCYPELFEKKESPSS